MKKIVSQIIFICLIFIVGISSTFLSKSFATSKASLNVGNVSGVR